MKYLSIFTALGLRLLQLYVYNSNRYNVEEVRKLFVPILTANKRCDNKRKTVVDRVYATIAINNGVSYELQHASRTRFVRFSVIGLQNICGNVAGIRDLLLRGSLSDFATIHDNTAEPIERPAILIIKTILNLIIGTA